MKTKKVKRMLTLESNFEKKFVRQCKLNYYSFQDKTYELMRNWLASENITKKIKDAKK